MHRIFKAVLRRMKWFVKLLFVYALRIFPIQTNKIVIMNYYGRGYGDNAKYICEKLLSGDCKYDIVWVIKNSQEIVPSSIRTIKYDSLRYYYELVTAKIWLDNCRKDIYIRKRKGQFYIQTWHGDMAIKKIEKDAKQSLSVSYIHSAINDSKMADLFVSGNKWMEHIYRNSMWYNGRIERCGYPRRDVLYDYDPEMAERVRLTCKVSKDKHIVLYAPTFRKQQLDPDLSVYDIDWKMVLKACEERFGGEWVALIRLHPNIAKYANKLIVNNKEVIDVTSYPDMQELLAIADVCISDYSSAILEFGLMGKPGFIFATDYIEYKKDRDVYFELSDLPFLVAEDNLELYKNIISFDSEKYNERRKQFYYSEIGMYEKGNAAYAISDLIRRVCFKE